MVPVNILCLASIAGTVLIRGLVGVLLARRFGNMNFEEMDIGKKGPCMVPGHPKEHKLELTPCWATMRRYLLTHSFEEFLREVNKKK